MRDRTSRAAIGCYTFEYYYQPVRYFSHAPAPFFCYSLEPVAPRVRAGTNSCDVGPSCRNDVVRILIDMDVSACATFLRRYNFLAYIRLHGNGTNVVITASAKRQLRLLAIKFDDARGDTFAEFYHPLLLLRYSRD